MSFRYPLLEFRLSAYARSSRNDEALFGLSYLKSYAAFRYSLNKLFLVGLGHPYHSLRLGGATYVLLVDVALQIRLLIKWVSSFEK